MSFLFKSRKTPPAPTASTALPNATRGITSSHGERSMIPTPTKGSASQTAFGAHPSTARSPSRPSDFNNKIQTPTPGSSLTASVNSLASGSPELAGYVRDMQDGDTPNVRSPSSAGIVLTGNPRAAQGDSPYPWSQRRLHFTTGHSPFPRYGAAVNSAASKEGWVYLMGGLVNSTTVKGDLWIVEAAGGASSAMNSAIACYPVQTPSEGPGPRVGHASLLVGNAFIVFGGDTKLLDEDVLDDTLYLLNTASKQWSKALPAGPRPAGRYGHTLNILGSKIYIFGGQVDGFFFNDLVAFNLNGLQVPGNRWQILIPNSKDAANSAAPVPPPRTNHSCVTWQDRLYLFGGTDGTRWFNDVWTYDPRTNIWSELDCIGYIPAPREGHAAALVDDTMYIFGGRVHDGSDLSDLAAFRISSRRWYMFQNMGMSPSARSGHSMTACGKNVIVLGGEPSTAPHDAKELSMAYVLDTSKIRYPPIEAAAAQQMATTGTNGAPQSTRKFSTDENRPDQQPQRPGSAIPVKSMASPPGVAAGPDFSRGQESQIPRPGTSSGPPPTQQAPQPQGQARTNGIQQDAPASKPKKGSKTSPRASAPNGSHRSDMVSPESDDANTNALAQRAMSPRGRPPSEDGASNSNRRAKSPPPRKSGPGSSRPGSRAGSKATNKQHKRGSSTSSINSVVNVNGQNHNRGSIDDTRSASRNTEIFAPDSGIGSPALSQQNDELLRELEAARSRNAWYASELALAKKAGYAFNSSSGNSILDEKAADVFTEDDRPLIEALLQMREEVSKVQGSIERQALQAANKLADVERQRDSAVQEAMYAKAKLAAHGGDVEGARGGTPDVERVGEMSRRLAASVAAAKEMERKTEKLGADLEQERRARALAEETADAAEKRVTELDAYRQRATFEVESLRAALHEAERVAREEAACAAEAVAAQRSLEVDQAELGTKHAVLSETSQNHEKVMRSLHEAVSASTDKASLLEDKLTEERSLRARLEQQLSALRSQNENNVSDLENAQRRLRDAEELADKNAAEARAHREAVLSGLGRATSRASDDASPTDQRVALLQAQVTAANALVRKNQQAADNASEKLRRAEERIAGLEAYQEQSSREGLAIRKQLQVAMRDSQASAADKSETQQQLERHRLEANALEVQLKTLKGLLDERGISSSAADRRSRVLDSPSVAAQAHRFGTPDVPKIRELEHQLDQSVKAHEELRQGFEAREQEVAREYEAKLANLENDYQVAAKYMRGSEKMLAKMKQELQRTMGAKDELEKELAGYRNGSAAGSRDVNGTGVAETEARWASEREALRTEMAEMQETLRATIAELEAQIESLKSNVEASEQQRAQLHRSLQSQHQQHQQEIDKLGQRARGDLELAHRENIALSERARDAENKVQMFLDQFETSVDNYRRRSRMPMPDGGAAVGGAGEGEGEGENKMPTVNGTQAHKAHDSTSGESTCSSSAATSSDDCDDDVNGTPTADKVKGQHPAQTLADGAHSPATAATASASLKPAANGDPRQRGRDRSSTALDSLASELESLRTTWETTNKNYKLDDKFDFERGPTSGLGDDRMSMGMGLGDVGSWRARFDGDEGAGALPPAPPK